MIPLPPQPAISTDIQTLAQLQRDYYVALARQAMAAARKIEKQYGLPPAKGMGRG